jgi:hypothetical protein
MVISTNSSTAMKDRQLAWALAGGIPIDALETRHGKVSWVLKREFQAQNLYRPARNTAIMPGSSKTAHSLVPFLSDGMARKIVEMSTPIAIAMMSLAFMVYGSLGGIRPGSRHSRSYKKNAEISNDLFVSWAGDRSQVYL